MKVQLEILVIIVFVIVNFVCGEVVKCIVDLVLVGFSKVFFINVGVDVNENVICMVWFYIGCDKVLLVYCFYYGNIGSVIVVIGDWCWVLNEFFCGYVYFFNFYFYCSEFNVVIEEEECQCVLVYLWWIIECEGLMVIVVILLEFIFGIVGIFVLLVGYMQSVCVLVDEFGIVLIFDEVMVGFGCIGSWFVFEQDGVVLDLVIFVKGVNVGYVLVGGVLISELIVCYFDDYFFVGGLIYFGYLLVMVVIVVIIDVMKEEKVVENVVFIGNEVLCFGFEVLVEKYVIIGEVCGCGLFQVLELVSSCE